MTNQTNDQRERPARKPYEAPRIVSREKLEMMAGLCVPSPPAKSDAEALCSAGPINS